MLIVLLVLMERMTLEGINVKYIDYDWDCSPTGIILDEEFDSDKLGWKGGDVFKLININGRQILRKLDPVEQFAKGHRVNVQEE